MVSFLQSLVIGIESGTAYALMALALALVFKTAGILNFAQGTMAAFTGFIAFWLIAELGLPWLFGVALALAVVATGTLGIERVVARPVMKHGLIAVVVATLALDLMLSNFTEVLFGVEPLLFPMPLEAHTFSIGGVRITAWSIVSLLVSVAVLLTLAYIVQRTETGLAMRAFAQDSEASQLMGISEAKVSRTAWMLSALVGGVAGILLAPVIVLQVGYMSAVFLKGFTAAVLGGFTSLSGAVYGGLALGLLESFATRYAPNVVSLSLPLVIVLLVLLLRPQGLFSREVTGARI